MYCTLNTVIFLYANKAAFFFFLVCFKYLFTLGSCRAKVIKVSQVLESEDFMVTVL